jgi:D-amino-acid dehydrogenase
MTDTLRCDALVLGAGIVGVASALMLRKAGLATVLADRDPPGLGASFGNAGLIQAEAVEPTGFPRDPWRLLAMLSNRRTDVVWDWRGVLAHAPALLAYWRNSAPARLEAAAEAYGPLIRASRPAHEALIDACGARGLVGGEGLTVLHRAARDLDADAAFAERMRARWGVASRVWQAADRPEGLDAIDGPHAGGVTWTEPLAIADPHALTLAYLARFEALGGRVLRADARGLSRHGTGWRLDTAEGPVTAAQAVLCLGAETNELAGLTGLRLPLVPKRGHHAHFAPAANRGLSHPVVDGAYGYVMAPMRAGLRLTTGAQIAAKPVPVQLARAEAAARGLFAFGARTAAPAWTGVRPCMADLLPAIGPVPGRAGLWLATGHGHQGLTMAAITGRMVAAMLSGTAPPLDPAPYAPARLA